MKASTQEMLTMLRKTLDAFNGKVVGYDATGKIECEFPDAHWASGYITWQMLSDDVVALRVADAQKPYRSKATVTFQS
jgi:hypothetical protein